MCTLDLLVVVLLSISAMLAFEYTVSDSILFIVCVHHRLTNSCIRWSASKNDDLVIFNRTFVIVSSADPGRNLYLNHRFSLYHEHKWYWARKKLTDCFCSEVTGDPSIQSKPTVFLRVLPLTVLDCTLRREAPPLSEDATLSQLTETQVTACLSVSLQQSSWTD